jgi:flavin-dependent dehydrogenase
MIHCDALVAGVGPAGALAARELAQVGFRVVIAGGVDATSPKIGESLPGVGLRLLRSLRIDDAEFGTVHQRIGGNLFCWSSEDLDATDFFGNPDGPGWRLTRHRFDACLLSAAVAGGVTHLPFHVDNVARIRGIWEARLKSDDVVMCRWLVDATGRNSVLARKLGVARMRDHGLAALCSFGSPRRAVFDRTLIEAVPEGWWYGAVLPDGKGLLVLHVRPQDARAARQEWPEALDRTRFMQKFFPRLGFGEHVSVRDAGGSRLHSFYGSNWVACGDAAMSFDPLSSQGIYTAMYSGLSAAQAIAANEGGDVSALPNYARRLDGIGRVYKARLTSGYGLVRRWPDAPFWMEAGNTS